MSELFTVSFERRGEGWLGIGLLSYIGNQVGTMSKLGVIWRSARPLALVLEQGRGRPERDIPERQRLVGCCHRERQ